MMNRFTPVFFMMIFVFFSSALYANQNVFELIAPSSYRPANLLSEFKVIDGGYYRLNLRQDMQSLFPGKKLVQADVYLALPNSCRIDEISSGYKAQYRTDFSYYIFTPRSDSKMRVDVSLAIRTAAIEASRFDFVVVAKDDQGNTLIHTHQDADMHKGIIMREYLETL